MAVKPRFKFSPGKTKYGKRHVPGVMNKTESEYADCLEARKRLGEILDWQFECYTLKLADGTRFTPDFAITFPNGTMHFIDVKGGGPIDAKSVVKVKCAAEKFWMFEFFVDQKQAKKNGGGWKRICY